MISVVAHMFDKARFIHIKSIICDIIFFTNAIYTSYGSKICYFLCQFKLKLPIKLNIHAVVAFSAILEYFISLEFVSLIEFKIVITLLDNISGTLIIERIKLKHSVFRLST